MNPAADNIPYRVSKPLNLKNPYLIGIDPGLNGAIAVYDTRDKNLVALEQMPTMISKNKKQINPYELAAIIETYAHGARFAVIEEVGARPGQGVVSMFSFGKAYGMAIMACAAQNIETRFVAPSVWKMLMKLDRDKSKSLNAAREFFPLWKKSFEKTAHADKAEASLLCVFGDVFYST